MKAPHENDTNFETGACSPEAAARGRGLYGSIWRNWCLLAGVLLVSTIGLAAAIPPLLGERIATPWPWVKTDLVLLIGLSLIVIVFVGYLTQQQRRVIAIHRELTILREESDKRIRQHTARLFALSNISHMISVETDLQNIFDRITRMCIETFNCYRASLMCHDAGTNELTVRSVGGHSDTSILNARQRVGEGIAGYAAQCREPILLSGPADYARYPGLELKDPSLTSAMVVPIIVRDELVGVLNVSSRSRDVVYDENDLLALQGFASSAGACIRHTEQASWIRRMVPQLSDEAAEGFARER
jgi:putative methionine-R-sulfoxide reductase with GAF domain